MESSTEARDRRDQAAMRALRDEGLDVRGRYAGEAFEAHGGSLLVFDRGLEPGFAWVEPAPDFELTGARWEPVLVADAEDHARLAICAAGFDPRAEPRPEIVLVRDRGAHLDVWHSTAIVDYPHPTIATLPHPTVTRVEADDLPAQEPDAVAAANVIYEAYERAQEVLDRLRPVARAAVLPEDAWAMGCELEVALEELGLAASLLAKMERPEPRKSKEGPTTGPRR